MHPTDHKSTCACFNSLCSSCGATPVDGIEDDVYIVTELMGSDLHGIIQSQIVSNEHIKWFIYQILRALLVRKPSHALPTCADGVRRCRDVPIMRPTRAVISRPCLVRNMSRNIRVHSTFTLLESSTAI
jgi:hypothetical protein